MQNVLDRLNDSIAELHQQMNDQATEIKRIEKQLLDKRKHLEVLRGELEDFRRAREHLAKV